LSVITVRGNGRTMERATELHLTTQDLIRQAKDKAAHDVVLADLNIPERLKREASFITITDGSDTKVLKNRRDLEDGWPPRTPIRLNGERFEFRVWDEWHARIYEKSENPIEREYKGAWVYSTNKCFEGRLAHFFSWIETHADNDNCTIEFQVIGEFDWIPFTTQCIFPERF